MFHPARPGQTRPWCSLAQDSRQALLPTLVMVSHVAQPSGSPVPRTMWEYHTFAVGQGPRSRWTPSRKSPWMARSPKHDRDGLYHAGVLEEPGECYLSHGLTSCLTMGAKRGLPDASWASQECLVKHPVLGVMVITRRDSALSGDVLRIHHRACRSMTRRIARREEIETSKGHGVGKEEENERQNKRKDDGREG